MRKKEGRVKIQMIDNNNERANEYAKKERRKKIILFSYMSCQNENRFPIF
jgi:hypothetical protein